MNEVFDQISRYRIVFFSTFFVVFTLSYVALAALDWLPEMVEEESLEVISPEITVDQIENVIEAEAIEEEAEDETEPLSVIGESDPVEADFMSEIFEPNIESVPTSELGKSITLPTKIVIDRLDKEIVVLNPESRTIADLDEALLSGVVRHPDSANLQQDGNVFILGHSSYLPSVTNRNFQAFNGIQKLQWGDIIKVYSAEEMHVYRVEKVYKATAQDLTVPIADTGKMLTLATCNSFGSVDDRYIVEAKHVWSEKQ